MRFWPVFTLRLKLCCFISVVSLFSPNIRFDKCIIFHFIPRKSRRYIREKKRRIKWRKSKKESVNKHSKKNLRVLFSYFCIFFPRSGIFPQAFDINPSTPVFSRSSRTSLSLYLSSGSCSVFLSPAEPWRSSRSCLLWV